MLWNQRKNSSDPDFEKSIRILAIGESTTQGWPGNTYPNELEAILKTSSPGRKFKVYNEGISGIQTYEIASRLNLLLSQYRPHIVLTMIGANDSYASLTFNPEKPKYRSSYSSLRIFKLFKLLGGRLLPKIKSNQVAQTNVNLANNTSGPSVEVLKSPDSYFQWIMNGNVPPDSQLYYKSIAVPLMSLDRGPDAIRMLTEIRKKYPGQAWAVGTLAELYRNYGESKTAIPLFKEAIQLQPGENWFKTMLAYAYNNSKDFASEAALLETELASAPWNHQYTLMLSDCYKKMNETEKQISILKRALNVAIKNVAVLDSLIRVLNENGRAEEAATFVATRKALNPGYYFPATVTNYRWIAEQVYNSGAKLFAVQYPLRLIGPLKDVLPQRSSTFPIFVENKDNFQEALKVQPESKIFIDYFAGDFGHMSLTGNRILADNIATAILANTNEDGR